MIPLLGVVAGIALVIAGARWLCRWVIDYAREQPVFINDLQLPPSYVRQIIWSPWDDFIVPEAQDAYGRYWEPGVVNLCPDVRKLQAWRADPRCPWPDDERYLFAGAAEAWAIDPHFIPYITDFSQLLWIGGTAGGGNKLYLDYRANPLEPSVILWNGIYWRRIAPDCETFLALLESRWLQRHHDWHPASCRGPGVKDCVTVALAAVAHYDIWGTAVLIDIVWSEQNEPTVVLLPDPLDPRWANAGEPDWRIWVTVPVGASREGWSGQEDGVTTTMRGTVREVDPDAPHAKLGHALLAASRYLARSGGPGIAGIVRAYQVPDDWVGTARRYMIDVGDVERWQSYRPKIWVSEDLIEVEIA